VYAKHWPAQLPRKGFYFLLDQKATKNQVGKKASLPHGPLPCKADRTTGWNLLPPLRSLIAPCFSKISYALATHKATIVLPVFARSCFADPEEKNPALGIEADTGLAPNTCARISGKPGPKATP
jgi:hypothetical protein